MNFDHTTDSSDSIFMLYIAFSSFSSEHTSTHIHNISKQQALQTIQIHCGRKPIRCYLFAMLWTVNDCMPGTLSLFLNILISLPFHIWNLGKRCNWKHNNHHFHATGITSLIMSKYLLNRYKW